LSGLRFIQQPKTCPIVIACDSFKLKKRRQTFVGTNDESLSAVAVSVCREKHATSRITVAGSSGDFADSIAVFAVPKHIGLKSHIRLSGVLVKTRF
jgi:hypothetical protein